MDLIVERTDGRRIEYPRAEKSKVVIEFVENHKRDTVIYYPEDFARIEVKRPGKRAVLGMAGIDALIGVIDRTVAASKSYEDKHLREYYGRDMAALRSMLTELKGGVGNGAE